MADNLPRISTNRKFSFLAIWLCIISCTQLLVLLTIRDKNLNPLPKMKHARRIDIRYDEHFCNNINAKWPQGFPKIVEKQNYRKQKIPYPFFEFLKWNNTHLDSISEMINPTGENYNTVDIISVVSSSLMAYKSRLAMRQTLGMFQNIRGYSHKLVFLIGLSNNASIQSQIDKEAESYGDLLQFDVDDSYRGLTKKRFQGLKWAIENCQKASLVLYLTDDVVINLADIIKHLKPLHNLRKLALGCLNRRPGRVFRKGKYSIYSEPPLNWGNHLYTPPYLFGYANVFSKDVAIDLYKLACKTPLTFTDDRYIGILLAMLGIPLKGSICVVRTKKDRKLGEAYEKTTLKKWIWKFNPKFVHLYSDTFTASVMKQVWKDLTKHIPTQVSGPIQGINVKVKSPD